jgi:hypothetical protein
MARLNYFYKHSKGVGYVDRTGNIIAAIGRATPYPPLGRSGIRQAPLSRYNQLFEREYVLIFERVIEEIR